MNTVERMLGSLVTVLALGFPGLADLSIVTIERAAALRLLLATGSKLASKLAMNDPVPPVLIVLVERGGGLRKFVRFERTLDKETAGVLIEVSSGRQFTELGGGGEGEQPLKKCPTKLGYWANYVPGELIDCKCELAEVDAPDCSAVPIDQCTSCPIPTPMPTPGHIGGSEIPIWLKMWRRGFTDPTPIDELRPGIVLL